MSKQWLPSEKLLAGFQCAENVRSGELTFGGHYGDIWRYGESDWRAIIYSHRIAKRHLPKHQHPIHAGDETLIMFAAQDLAVWMGRLWVPAKASTQAEVLNRRQESWATSSNITEEDGEIFSSEPRVESKSEDRGQSPKPGLTTADSVEMENPAVEPKMGSE